MNATTSHVYGTSAVFPPTQIPVPPRFKRRRQQSKQATKVHSKPQPTAQESLNTASSTLPPPQQKGSSSATRPQTRPHRSASYNPHTLQSAADKSLLIWTRDDDSVAKRASFDDAQSKKNATLWDEDADLQEIVHRNNIHRYASLLSSTKHAAASRHRIQRPLPGPMGRSRAVSTPAYLSNHSTSSLRLKEPQLPLHIYDTYLPALPESFSQQEPPTIHILPASQPKSVFPTDALGLNLSLLTTQPHPPLPSLEPRLSRSSSIEGLQPSELSPAECSPSSGTDSASSFSIPDEDSSDATTPPEQDSPDLNSKAPTFDGLDSESDYAQHFSRLPFPTRSRYPVSHRNLVAVGATRPSAPDYDDDGDVAEDDSDRDHMIPPTTNRRTPHRPHGGVTRGRGRHSARTTQSHRLAQDTHLLPGRKHRSFSTGNLPRVPFGEDPLASPSFHDSDLDETASLPDIEVHYRKPSSGSVSSVASSSESFRALFSAAWTSFVGMSNVLVDGYAPSMTTLSPRSTVDSMSHLAREADYSPLFYPSSLVDIKPYGYRVDSKEVHQIFGEDNNVGEKVINPTTPAEEPQAGGLATILGYLSGLAHIENEVASAPMTGRFGGSTDFSAYDDLEYPVPHRMPIGGSSRRMTRSVSAPTGFTSGPGAPSMTRSSSDDLASLQSRHLASSNGTMPSKPPVSVALQRYPIIPYHPPELVVREVFPKLRDRSKPLWWASMVPGGHDGKVDEEVGYPAFTSAKAVHRQTSQPQVRSVSRRNDVVDSSAELGDLTLNNGSDVTDSEDELNKAIARDQERQRRPSPTSRLASFAHITKSSGSDLSSAIASVMRQRKSRSRSGSRSRSRDVAQEERRESVSPSRTRRNHSRTASSGSLQERGRGRVPRVIEMFEEDDQSASPLELGQTATTTSGDPSSVNIDAVFPPQFAQGSPSAPKKQKNLGKGVHPSAVFGPESSHQTCQHSQGHSSVSVSSAFDYVVSGGGDVRKPNIWLLCAIRGSLRDCAQVSDVDESEPFWEPISAPAPSAIFSSPVRQPLARYSIGSSAIEAEGLLTHKINSFYSTYGRAASAAAAAAAAAAASGPSGRESRKGDKRKFGLTRGRSTVPPTSSISCSPVRRSAPLTNVTNLGPASCCHRASKLRREVADARLDSA